MSLVMKLEFIANESLLLHRESVKLFSIIAQCWHWGCFRLWSGCGDLTHPFHILYLYSSQNQAAFLFPLKEKKKKNTAPLKLSDSICGFKVLYPVHRVRLQNICLNHALICEKMKGNLLKKKYRHGNLGFTPFPPSYCITALHVFLSACNLWKKMCVTLFSFLSVNKDHKEIDKEEVLLKYSLYCDIFCALQIYSNILNFFTFCHIATNSNVFYGVFLC